MQSQCDSYAHSYASMNKSFMNLYQQKCRYKLVSIGKIRDNCAPWVSMIVFDVLAKAHFITNENCICLIHIANAHTHTHKPSQHLNEST